MNIDKLLSGNIADEDIKRELKIPADFKMKGYVYVLSNEAMPGIYKIGMTERSVEERVKELSKMTAIPTPFKIEACFYSDNPLADEREIHELLSQYRVSENKEFFKCDLDKVKDFIREVLELEKGDELTSTACTYDIIGLGSGSDDFNLDDDFEGEFLPLMYLGNEFQIKKFLIQVGAKTLSEILSKNYARVVLMPNNEIKLVRSADEQMYLGEIS